jgi:glycine cleavage system H protein
LITHCNSTVNSSKNTPCGLYSTYFRKIIDLTIENAAQRAYSHVLSFVSMPFSAAGFKISRPILFTFSFSLFTAFTYYYFVTFATQKFINRMAQFPNDLKYSKDHEWVRIQGDTATVGITAFAQGELGDIVYVEIETIGDSLGMHDVFGTVEAVKTVSDLFMPISGEVLEKNDRLDDEPELVNSDPYGDGWMVKIRMSNPGEANELMTADQYKEMIGQ